MPLGSGIVHADDTPRSLLRSARRQAFATAANLCAAEEGALRIRAIAGVGVVLCVAMTSFSIYLGVVEHVYAAPRQVQTKVVFSYSPEGRQATCFTSSPRGSTTTTTPSRAKQVPCIAISRN
jgi:hypothetical protein